MLRPYVSKSSIECFCSCNLKYIFSYHLGYRDPPRKKTVLGTIAHTIAEILATIKKEIQSGKSDGKIESEIGEVEWTEFEFNFPSILTQEEVDKINKSRKNKKTYIGNCLVKVGDIRYGRDFVNNLIERAWQKISKDTASEVGFWNQEWEPSDRYDLYNFCWLLLENFDPRKVNVLDVEKEFDLPIEHPDCLINGEYIRVKGFIDLVYGTPEIIQFVDYKTGERKDFNSGEEKTLNCLSKDLQLCLYKYAIKKIYPDVKHIIGSICFIRDGGLFTPEFDEDSDTYIYNEIKKHIQELKNSVTPSVLSETREDFRCKYLCGQSKLFDYSNEKCNCQFIKEKIREIGVVEVINEYRKNKNEIT